MAVIINYYVAGLNRSLLVELACDASMNYLRYVVGAKLGQRAEDKFVFYRVKRAIDVLVGLETLKTAVEDLFADGKPLEDSLEEITSNCRVSGLLHFDQDYLHFIVCLPKGAEEDNLFDEGYNRGVKRRRPDELDDLVKERKLLLKITKHAPSSVAEPSVFEAETQHVVNCNRPFNFDTIPITLLQEDFGLFMDDCKVLPSPKSQELLQGLTVAACEWYETKSKRRSAIRDVFNEVADIYLERETISDTEYKTGGNLRVNIMPPAIRECKNEQGCGVFEVIAYYAQFLKSALDRIQIRDRFPCILLIDIGSYFGFYGCLWTGERIRVEPLTPLYDLTTHWTDENGRQAIAASLDAFLKSIPRLEAHYARLAIPHPHPSLQDRNYPYITSYEDEKGQRIRFLYRSRIPEKLVFMADPDSSSDKKLGALCIKFTKRYSVDAHRFLAQLGYAPQLRAFVQLPGKWFMVVMDCSKYTQLDGLSLPYELQLPLKTKLTMIVKQFHEAGFVHGDLRSINLLIDLETLTSKDHDVQIHFIDFDWAGRQGETMYPMRVNTLTVKRPEGVSDGEPILVEHDIAMLNYLLK